MFGHFTKHVQSHLRMTRHWAGEVMPLCLRVIIMPNDRGGIRHLCHDIKREDLQRLSLNGACPYHSRGTIIRLPTHVWSWEATRVHIHIKESSASFQSIQLTLTVFPCFFLVSGCFFPPFFCNVSFFLVNNYLHSRIPNIGGIHPQLKPSFAHVDV